MSTKPSERRNASKKLATIGLADEMSRVCECTDIRSFCERALGQSHLSRIGAEGHGHLDASAAAVTATACRNAMHLLQGLAAFTAPPLLLFYKSPGISKGVGN